MGKTGWMAVVVAAVLAGGLASWSRAGQQPAAQRPASITYTGEDDEVATKRLLTLLKAWDADVVDSDQESVVVRKERKYILRPKMQQGRLLDRITIVVAWTVGKDHQGTDAVMKFANQLDRDYNIGGFYMDEDGDLALQTQITFLDELTWRELNSTLEWLDGSISRLVHDTRATWDKLMSGPTRETPEVGETAARTVGGRLAIAGLLRRIGAAPSVRCRDVLRYAAFA